MANIGIRYRNTFLQGELEEDEQGATISAPYDGKWYSKTFKHEEFASLWDLFDKFKKYIDTVSK